jgi:hypothetical protein
LLPAPYFLLIFTLPAELRSVAQQQPRLIYNLLFRASAAAAQELARDPRFSGSQLGLIGILQTWARNLTYHPHIHYLVPGGGWDPTTQAGHAARPDFLLPVKALSVLFRAKFREGLRQHALFRHIPAAVWQQDWVVHCLSVGTGAPALKYLAPYVFQVATPCAGAQRRCKCQQSAYRQPRKRPGQFRLHRCPYPAAADLYPGRARLHRPFLAARPAQRVLQGALRSH